MLAGMAATLGVPVPEIVPPLWHWTLFQEWLPAHALGADGHPRRGGFLPALPDFGRRMWAGGRVRFIRDLRVGDAVTRFSTVRSVQEKTGRSGRLVFVTVHHAINGPDGPAIDEEQDLVYCGTNSLAVGAPAPVEDAPAGPRAELCPDPVLLFRYSALTGNGHRIHYDLDYARTVEGYPGLVVHGPLQATLLAGLLRRPPGRFHYRGLRPAFHAAMLRFEAWDRDGATMMRTRDADGAVCLTAEAYF